MSALKPLLSAPQVAAAEASMIAPATILPLPLVFLGLATPIGGVPRLTSECRQDRGL
ncbi:hypothetical protein [Erythrobacter sp.]|uniref:hypothetical protein n=1 Tax=Erythrobacter sp. TaxID=1042 RepID=UPI0025CDD6B6|nr:hypothetical protein [Erythrobacter sp.]